MATIEDFCRLIESAFVPPAPASTEAQLRALLRAYWRRVQGDEKDDAFGEKLGYSRSLVYQIRENRGNQVTVSHLARLAEYQHKSLIVVLIELVALALNDPSSLVDEGEPPPGSGGESRVRGDVAEKMRRKKRRT